MCPLLEVPLWKKVCVCVDSDWLWCATSSIAVPPPRHQGIGESQRMDDLMLGDVKEEVPGRSSKIAGTEVNIAGDGTVQLTLHLTCPSKGLGLAPSTMNLLLIGRYIQDEISVPHSWPICGWDTSGTLGWLRTGIATLYTSLWGELQEEVPLIKTAICHISHES